MRWNQQLVLCLAIVLMGILSACENKSQETGNTAAADSNVVVTKPTGPPSYLAAVDDLRLRSQPNTEGEVIIKVPEGTLLKGTGEVSAHEDEFTLRGEKRRAPWFEVEAPNGKKGWVFGGALTVVEPGQEKTAQQQAEVLAYRNYLEGLQLTDCASVTDGIKEYKKRFASAGPELRDRAFLEFMEFHQRFLDEQSSLFDKRNDLESFENMLYADRAEKVDPKADQQVRIWAKCGIELIYPEGMIGLDVQPGFYTQHFADQVSKSMAAYLQQRKMENQQGTTEDGGLTVEPVKLVERSVFWEEFDQKYPNFLLKDEAKYLHRMYLRLVLASVDNTPAFDYGTEKLDSSFKKAYELALNKYPETVTGQVLGDYYQVLKESNWMRGEGSEQFLKSYFNDNPF